MQLLRWNGICIGRDQRRMNQIKERKKGIINMAKTKEQSFSGDHPPTYGSSQCVLTAEPTILTLHLAATT